MEDSFNSACAGEKQEFSFVLADFNVAISTSSPDLLELTCKAFTHLNRSDHTEKDLVIEVWDEKETGIAIPFPPVPMTPYPDSEYFRPYSLGNYFIHFSDYNKVLYVYDKSRNKAIVCIKDVHQLPNSFLAAPYFKILKIWSRQMGLGILHAGCVGNNDHAVLLVGKGGSGKSTSCIQSLMDGLQYISDDYVLVRYGEEPIAYSIFCSAKLHADHIERFPELAAVSSPGKYEIDDKPLVFLIDIYADRIIQKRPINAIIAPQVISDNDSRMLPISSLEALKALAPSTIIQLDMGDNGEFAEMAKLTRKLPSYKLELGYDLRRISPVIRDLLDSL